MWILLLLLLLLLHRVALASHKTGDVIGACDDGLGAACVIDRRRPAEPGERHKRNCCARQPAWPATGGRSASEEPADKDLADVSSLVCGAAKSRLLLLLLHDCNECADLSRPACAHTRAPVAAAIEPACRSRSEGPNLFLPAAGYPGCKFSALRRRIKVTTTNPPVAYRSALEAAAECMRGLVCSLSRRRRDGFGVDSRSAACGSFCGALRSQRVAANKQVGAASGLFAAATVEEVTPSTWMSPQQWMAQTKLARFGSRK